MFAIAICEIKKDSHPVPIWFEHSCSRFWTPPLVRYSSDSGNHCSFTRSRDGVRKHEKFRFTEYITSSILAISHRYITYRNFWHGTFDSLCRSCSFCRMFSHFCSQNTFDNFSHIGTLKRISLSRRKSGERLFSHDDNTKKKKIRLIGSALRFYIAIFVLIFRKIQILS